MLLNGRHAVTGIVLVVLGNPLSGRRVVAGPTPGREAATP